MSYFVYLKRSLHKRNFRHLFFFIILTCTMVMPLILSIYSSSVQEGIRQFVLDSTKGSVFWIENAKETDLMLFQDLESLEARYEDHVIYLSLTADADPDSEELNRRQEHQLQHIINERSNSNLHPLNNFYFGRDESYADLVNENRRTEWMIAGIALLVFLACYGAHLRLFRTDIGILRSIGAGKGEIVLLFWIEFIVTFFVAGLAAAGITAAAMRLLYQFYLGTTFPTFLWYVNHIDAGQFLFHFVPYLIGGSIFSCVYTLFLCRRDILAMIRDNHDEGFIRNGRKQIPDRKKPAAVLSSLFLRRTNRTMVLCAVLLFLTMIPVVYACNDFSVTYDAIHSSDYDLCIFCEEYGDSMLSKDELNGILGMEAVDAWRTEPVIQPTDFLIPDSRMSHYTDVEWDEEPCAMTNIYRAVDYDAFIGETLGKYDVIVTGSFERLPYRVGNRIILQPSAEPYRDPIELQVAALADIPRNEYRVDLFLSNELFDELTKDFPIGEIDLRLKERSSAPLVAEKLVADYPVLEDLILDEYSTDRETARLQLGHILMYSVLYLLLIFCVFVIILFRILEHFREQTTIRTTLKNIGTTRKMIRSAYIRQTFIMFLSGIIPALIGGYLLSLYSLPSAGAHFTVSLASALLQLAIAVLAGLAFVLPALIISGKQFTKEGFIDE